MNLKNKKILIAGFGVEGRATFEYLKNIGAKDIAIADNNKDLKNTPKNTELILGDQAFQDLKDFDVVFRSPQIAPYKIITNGNIWSATNEFFDKCPSKKTIGVTGTKGKGTTCSLIAEALRNAGKTVHLVGNIGVPALQTLPLIKEDDIVVYELSSFQLWDIKYSPKTAVVLMVEPDHLDVHKDIEEYIEAKSRIVRYQTKADVVVRHPNNTTTSQVVLPAKSEKISYMSDNRDGAYIENEHIMIEDIPICAVSDVGLLGEHNLENICAAVTAVWQYSEDVASTQKALKEFKGLPHRLEFYKEINAKKYYDDSFAAAPSAAAVATLAFNTPVVQIIGGKDRGDLDYSKFSKVAKSAKHCVVIGENSDKIISNLKADNYSKASTMKEAVEIAASKANKDEVILLSPGSPSFDWYDNYLQRADDFRKRVDEL